MERRRFWEAGAASPPLEEAQKVFEVYPSLPENGSQSSPIKLPMIWNDDLSIGIISTQDDMTALLAPDDKT